MLKTKHFILGSVLTIMFVVLSVVGSVSAQTTACEAGKFPCDSAGSQCMTSAECAFITSIPIYCPTIQGLFCKPISFYKPGEFPAGVGAGNPGLPRGLLPYEGRLFCHGPDVIVGSSIECERVALEFVQQRQAAMTQQQQQPQQQWPQQQQQQQWPQQTAGSLSLVPCGAGKIHCGSANNQCRTRTECSASDAAVGLKPTLLPSSQQQQQQQQLQWPQQQQQLSQLSQQQLNSLAPEQYQCHQASGKMFCLSSGKCMTPTECAASDAAVGYPLLPTSQPQQQQQQQQQFDPRAAAMVQQMQEKAFDPLLEQIADIQSKVELKKAKNRLLKLVSAQTTAKTAKVFQEPETQKAYKSLNKQFRKTINKAKTPDNLAEAFEDYISRFLMIVGITNASE